MTERELSPAYMKSIAHLDTPAQLALIHFWGWIWKQVGKRREYRFWTGIGFDRKEVVEVRTIVEITMNDSGDFCVGYRTKTGKAIWVEFLHESKFRAHWWNRNFEAQSPVVKALPNG